MLKSVVACPGPKWLQVLTDWHACNPVSVINSDRNNFDNGMYGKRFEMWLQVLRA
jgi:hypothetical protein